MSLARDAPMNRLLCRRWSRRLRGVGLAAFVVSVGCGASQHTMEAVIDRAASALKRLAAG